MNEESRMLKQAAGKAGMMIYNSLAGEHELSWELEDALKMTLSPKSASIAALTLIYALSQTHLEHEDDRRSILRHWERIVQPQGQLRFLPVIPLALRLLRAVPPMASFRLLDVLIGAAQQTKTPGHVSDIIQGLVEDRKQLGVYHTLPASATLMAHLAVPEDDQRWSSPQRAVDFRMADYSCGCGELLTAAYRRLRELHQEQGQDPSSIHHQMMSNAITAVDVLPASVAIAATELDLLEAKPKGTPSNLTRAITLQQGPITNQAHRLGKKTLLEDEKKPKQRPVGLGSLDLLDPSSLRNQERQPLGRKLPYKKPKPVELAVKSQDLVIMNPPYTRPTGAAGMDRNIPGGKPGVPPTSPQELRKMELRMSKIRKAAQAGVGTGLALHFSQIADLMVKPGGTIALLLPMSAVTTYNENINSNEGWSSFRRKLVERYRNIRIISIAGFEDSKSNFSHDTGIAEIMLIAQRTLPGEHPDREGHFINLTERPESQAEAARVAQAINQAVAELKKGPYCNHSPESSAPESSAPEISAREIILNGKKGGIAIRAEISEKEIWPMVRVLDPGLIQAAGELSKGIIRTSPGSPPTIIPTTLLEQIAVHGNPTPRIDFYLEPETPGNPVHGVLRWHESATQRALEVQINEKMSPRKAQESIRPESGERKMEQLMSRLHLNNNFRYNSQPTAACMTPEPSIGGQGWPNLVLGERRQEKALAVWLNTCLGLLTHWSRSNRTQNGLGYLNRLQTGKLPVLDVTQLTNRQLDRMEKIFEQVKESPMLPANEAWQDPIRAQLDQRVLTEVLELKREAVDWIRDLRNRWCMEPTVQARKGGSACRQQNMDKLRELVGAGGTQSWEEETMADQMAEPVGAQMAEPRHLMVPAAKMAEEVQAEEVQAEEVQPVKVQAVKTNRTHEKLRKNSMDEQPTGPTGTDPWVAEPKTPTEQPIPEIEAEVPPKTPAEPKSHRRPDQSKPVRNKPEIPTSPILRELSEIFQFEVHAVCKTVGRAGKKSTEYNLRTECGPVHIGPVSNILKQKAFRNIIADAIYRVVLEQKPARNWEPIAEKILQASVKIKHRATRAEPITLHE